MQVPLNPPMTYLYNHQTIQCPLSQYILALLNLPMTYQNNIRSKYGRLALQHCLYFSFSVCKMRKSPYRNISE